jgi:hypothetical protein
MSLLHKLTTTFNKEEFLKQVPKGVEVLNIREAGVHGVYPNRPMMRVSFKCGEERFNVPLVQTTTTPNGPITFMHPNTRVGFTDICRAAGLTADQSNKVCTSQLEEKPAKEVQQEPPRTKTVMTTCYVNPGIDDDTLAIINQENAKKGFKIVRTSTGGFESITVNPGTQPK